VASTPAQIFPLRRPAPEQRSARALPQQQAPRVSRRQPAADLQQAVKRELSPLRSPPAVAREQGQALRQPKPVPVRVVSVTLQVELPVALLLPV
jgi:hypothetical protein